jgi:transitional endoplasmic reticulum ATPase
MNEKIEALRQAVKLSPDNHMLRLLLAEALQVADQKEEALAEYDLLLQQGQLPRQNLLTVGLLAIEVQQMPLAQSCLNAMRYAGLVEEVSKLQAKIEEAFTQQGFVKMVVPQATTSTPSTQPLVPPPPPLEAAERVTFADIGGLEEVKKVIHRMIILPFLRPELYQAYGKKGGGGVLMYGPPGCGKTMLARATAGECGLPMYNVRIEEILDPYIGISERRLHHVFDQARLNAPCVLFIDEVDALAFARKKHTSSVTRTLVDQLLQELDAIGANNQNLLILAATNAPWDVDDALLRPGRFDRRVFVPPPDEPARVGIVQGLLKGRPVQGIEAAAVARGSALFSGADLRALVEAATDLAIEDALNSGTTMPLTAKHIDRARQGLRPTTLDWLTRAENYVEFANQDKRYDEVASYLKSAEVRKHKR